jgi:hypothetical protein
MVGTPPQHKIPLIFFRSPSGSEPVRDWLRGLVEEERQAIGRDLLRAQWRWPVACRFVDRWGMACGRFGLIFRQSELHAFCFVCIENI